MTDSGLKAFRLPLASVRFDRRAPAGRHRSDRPVVADNRLMRCNISEPNLTRGRTPAKCPQRTHGAGHRALAWIRLAAVEHGDRKGDS